MRQTNFNSLLMMMTVVFLVILCLDSGYLASKKAKAIEEKRKLMYIKQQEEFIAKLPDDINDGGINDLPGGNPYHMQVHNSFVNVDQDEFKDTQEDSVDLRIIVLAYDRDESLQKCLNALNDVDFDEDSIVIDIWIDRDLHGHVHGPTYEVANNFEFRYDAVHVHVQQEHAGIYGQWIETWYPQGGHPEMVLYLEDDMTVSPCFYKWLKKAHETYDKREDISGYTLQGDPKIALSRYWNKYVEVPKSHPVFLYKRHSSWGFSPHWKSWQGFVDWFHEVKKDPKFKPYVEGIISTDWFKGFEASGRAYTQWAQWHAYYVHTRGHYTLFANLDGDELLSVNRQEKGLHHDERSIAEKNGWQRLCKEWREDFGVFPEEPIKVDYGGHFETQK